LPTPQSAVSAAIRIRMSLAAGKAASSAVESMPIGGVDAGR
jgi:hypothetical protein